MTTQALLPFDVCASRHRGNANSASANLRVHEHKPSARERIRVFVSCCEFYGATLKEIAANLRHPTIDRWYFVHEISGRISEMKKAHDLFDSGRVRDGYAVYVTRQEWSKPCA